MSGDDVAARVAVAPRARSTVRVEVEDRRLEAGQRAPCSCGTAGCAHRPAPWVHVVRAPQEGRVVDLRAGRDVRRAAGPGSTGRRTCCTSVGRGSRGSGPRCCDATTYTPKSRASRLNVRSKARTNVSVAATSTSLRGSIGPKHRLVRRDLRRVGRVELAECDGGTDRLGVTGRRAHARSLLLADHRAARAGRERHQPDVLVEHDECLARLGAREGRRTPA